MPSPDVLIARNIPIEYVATLFARDGSVTTYNFGQIGAALGFYQDRRTVPVRTPNFRSLKKSEYPTNPYQFVQEIRYDPKRYYAQRGVSLDGLESVLMEYQTNAAGQGITLVAHNQNLYEADDPAPLAVNRFINNVNEGRVSTAVALAELGKTASHVASTATRLAKALTALRKGRLGDFTNALGVTTTERQTRRWHAMARDRKRVPDKRKRQESKITDALADTWLEYSYGWKPLLKDVYDHAAAAAKVMVNHNCELVEVSGRAHTIAFFKEDNFVGCRKHTKNMSSEKWASYNARFRTPIDAGSIAYAFGLGNPLSVAWELVPFSFVADWFLPIGDFLTNIQYHRGLTYSRGYTNAKHIWRCDGVISAGRDEYYEGKIYRFVGSAVHGNVEQIAFRRDHAGGFPDVPSPKWKDPRSFEHALSAISLLQSGFLRK